MTQLTGYPVDTRFRKETVTQAVRLDALRGVGLFEGLSKRNLALIDKLSIVRTVPAGEQGEIWIRGPMNFRGYWNKPEATRETLTDGWVRSGDIGYMDEEGFVFITDRKKDMVIRGGENIGCQEVEAAIYDHPDVSECAVFGVPDERLGEALAAVVVPKPGRSLAADDIKAHVAGHLARFKVPEHVEFMAELPRNASGKVLKRALSGA